MDEGQNVRTKVKEYRVDGRLCVFVCVCVSVYVNTHTRTQYIFLCICTHTQTPTHQHRHTRTNVVYIKNNRWVVKIWNLACESITREVGSCDENLKVAPFSFNFARPCQSARKLVCDVQAEGLNNDGRGV